MIVFPVFAGDGMAFFARGAAVSQMSTQFEKAVHGFIQRLDPSAEVTWNHHVPDRDTGSLRQVDVWINTNIFGHFPISIHVSCKHQKRKVTITQMGTFLNEVHSTGASTGIIYSSSGFAANALKKASTNGVTCCKLYQREPADLPKSLVFFSSFVCSSTFQIILLESPQEQKILTWNELFELPVVVSGKPSSLLQTLASSFLAHEKKEIRKVPETKKFPSPWRLVHTYRDDESEQPLAKVEVRGAWKVFKGRTEAHLLDGSYCFTDGTFAGGRSTPIVDTKAADPGPGWELLVDPPEHLPIDSVVMFKCGGDFEAAARSAMGTRPLPKLAIQPTSN